MQQLFFCGQSPDKVYKGKQGYLPTKNAFEEGGYEARSSRFTPTLEQEAKDSAKRLLDEYTNL